VKKQPELPDFVRDMEIVQSLNRTLASVRDAMNGPTAKESPDVTEQESS
jgi:hypothetical protein